MIKRLLVALLAVPASASAAPFTEAPHTLLPSDCARVTGTPGEVAVAGEDGMRMLHATERGFVAAERLPASGCAGVLTRPGGAGLIVDRESVTARDPGREWGAAEPLPVEPGWDIGSMTAALSERGDAVVAWSEERDSTHRLRVTRRTPGAPFGARELLAGPMTDAPQALESGIAATGEAFVLFSAIPARLRFPIRAPVRVAAAPPDGPFMAPTALGEIDLAASPALAVAQDGHALVAVPDGTSLRVSERSAGQPFGPLEPVTAARDDTGVQAVAQLRTGGAAVIALTGIEQEWVSVLSRSAPGAFTRIDVRAAVPVPPDVFGVAVSGGIDGFGGLFSRKPIELALAGDRALLVSSDFVTERGADHRAVDATVVPLGGGTFDRHVIGGALIDVADPTALLLADGTPAAVWTDPQLSFSRLHLATEGALGPDEPAAPRTRVGDPVDTALKRTQRLLLPVTCSRPCEVRAQVLGGSEADDALQLDRAGRGHLRLRPRSAPIAPRRPGVVRVRLTYGALGAHQPRSRTITVRLRRAAEPPLPRSVGLRAERSGDRIRVTWRTDQPTTGGEDDNTAFVVFGTATSASDAVPLRARVVEGRTGRRRFAVTLTKASAVKWVTLFTVNIGGFRDPQQTVVRVR